MIFFKIHNGISEDSDRHQPPLRVLTLNVFAGKFGIDMDRLQRQIEDARALNPDIIALQETFDLRVQAHYQQAFPHHEAITSGQQRLPRTLVRLLASWVQRGLEILNRAFGIFPWMPHASAIFDGDTHGLMFLINRHRVDVDPTTKLVKMYAIQAAPNPSTKFFDHLKPKAFLSVEVSFRGVRVLLVNTHLSNGVTNPLRMAQLRELVAHLVTSPLSSTTSSPSQPCPIIFCGDTNADIIEPEMRWLHTEGGFEDTFHQHNYGGLPEEGTRVFTWDNQKNPYTTQGHLLENNQFIDYISTRRSRFHRLQVTASQVVLTQRAVSDHFGVLTDVRVVPCSEELEQIEHQEENIPST